MFRIKLSKHNYRKLCEYIDQRDPHCLNCGRADMPSPAHIKRRSQGGNDSPNNMCKLCLECHGAYDRYEITLKPEIHEMLKNEPLYL